MLANENGIIHLSINPSYFCNFRCKHCYLTEAQLSNRQVLDLDVLDQRLTEIKASGHILGHADIYGGEVMVLPKGYMLELKELLHDHGIDEIEVITNLSAFNREIVDDQDFGLSVSYDFTERERHEEVYVNMLKLSRPFTILTLATPEIVKMDVDELILQLNTMANMLYWEIKPYSSNQANQMQVTFREYEEFVQRIIESPIPKHFEFLNESTLRQAVKNERNSFSDDHLYITPTGNFAVLEFDLNDNEYFLELEYFEKYLEWCLIEKSRVYENSYCSTCEFAGKCLSEHLREVKSLDNSCNGFHGLIKWAQVNLQG